MVQSYSTPHTRTEPCLKIQKFNDQPHLEKSEKCHEILYICVVKKEKSVKCLSTVLAVGLAWVVNVLAHGSCLCGRLVGWLCPVTLHADCSSSRQRREGRRVNENVQFLQMGLIPGLRSIVLS